jgi:hypothetical protein
MCFHYLGIVTWHRCCRFARALLAALADYAGKGAPHEDAVPVVSYELPVLT